MLNFLFRYTIDAEVADPAASLKNIMSQNVAIEKLLALYVNDRTTFNIIFPVEERYDSSNPRAWLDLQSKRFSTVGYPGR